MSLTAPEHRTSLTEDHKLRARARLVIPGGMYGHQKVDEPLLPSGYPQFYTRGKGARTWDADGNEYIDFMCAFGPMLLGYADERVDAVAAHQQAQGDPLTGPTPRMVELAELLTDTVAHADWAMFAKNGTDATSMSVMIARAATGRDKLLKARQAYHGANAWFTPRPGGVTAADRANIIEFEYNDLVSLEAAVAAADGDVAAIMVPPFRHDAFAPQELATAEFARGVRAIADRIGAALILDEVRTCFRLDLRGAWESLGVRPDLTAFSKALANGYALAAVTGSGALSDAATEVYTTGSFWYSGVAMAAAIETIRILREENAVATLVRSGDRLRAGLAQQALSHGFGLQQSGPSQMPAIAFDDDPKLRTAFAFTDAAVRRGVILHPWHNMFLSTSHTDAEIDAALDATDLAFQEVASLRG